MRGTFCELSADAKVVVLDNRRLAMVSQFQNITWGNDPSTGNRATFDFAGFAGLYEIPAFRVDRDDEIETTLDKFVATDGPALLHVRVDPACDVSPMLLAGQTMDQMWRWNDD